MSLQPTSEIHGIKFFDNASSCQNQFEKMHWTKKALGLIQSFGTLLTYSWNEISLFLHKVNVQMDPLTKADYLYKKRLVVCIHGLNNRPTQFKSIVDEMNKKDLSSTDVFIPRVHKNGNTTLNEAVEPIFKKIEEWAKKNGEKELVLVGISNGGRIARAIEAELVKANNIENIKNIKKLRFVSIVGACKGSALANLTNKVGLSWLMSKNISEEMPTDSKRNQQLNKEWMQGLSKGPAREYIFIASPHDWQVTNYDSSLMSVDKEKALYAIVPNHGHNSIVNAVAKAVTEIILK